jgi:hypothetical protein
MEEGTDSSLGAESTVICDRKAAKALGLGHLGVCITAPPKTRFKIRWGGWRDGSWDGYPVVEKELLLNPRQDNKQGDRMQGSGMG